jgi:hypothetical protein
MYEYLHVTSNHHIRRCQKEESKTPFSKPNAHKPDRKRGTTMKKEREKKGESSTDEAKMLHLQIEKIITPEDEKIRTKNRYDFKAKTRTNQTDNAV